MIKNNKRSAADAGEASKNKSPKLDKKGPAKATSAGSKFSKSSKGDGKQFAAKFNKTGKDFKPKGKDFKGKAGNFKPNSKFSNSNNKFKGKPDKDQNGGGEPEKTDWRKFKQEKKELKQKRKQSKDSYELTVEAKQIYEKLKCRRSEKKNELVEKLYNLLSAGDAIKKLIMAHDTARIIQCMLKFATPSLRDQLSERLLPMSVDMSVSKYSHFCILRMFKYGSPSIKSKLVDSFFGNVVRLACHNISSKILDHVYLTVASNEQKINLRQEFYGDLYKNSKDANVKQLSDTYKDSGNMKASILGSVKSNLEHVANKQLVDNSLVHAVMLEYLKECDEEKMEETVGMFAPLIPLMLSTKDGSQAGIICFYKAAPKNRRAIIKTIKEHLVKICTHEHGHIFMLAVLNSLDDTKATKKAIYDNIHPELETLMSNQWGRRIVEWLVSPSDTNCFHPTFIANLDEGLQYGKKDKDLRRKEIFEQIEEPLANAMEQKPDFWLSNKHIGLVSAEILKKLTGNNFEKAASALVGVIAQPKWTVLIEDETKEKKTKKPPQDVEKIIADATKQKKKNKQKLSKNTQEEGDDNSDAENEKSGNEEETPKTEVAGIEEAGLHIVLKKILKNDKERLSQNAEQCTFGSLLLQQLSEETIKYWLTVNRACFVLLNLVENNNDDSLSQLKSLLKPQLNLLKQQSSSGAKLLLKKLA